MAQCLKWTRPTTLSTCPPARGGHTFTAIGNLLIVFGGTAFENGKFVYYNDTWALDTLTLQWHKPTLAGKGPAARYGHTAVCIDYKLYIFGGKGEKNRLLNDIYCLDVETWSWQHVPSASAAPPAGRYGHTMVAIGPRLCIFGGTDGKTCNSEVWLFDLNSRTWAKPTLEGAIPSGRHYSSAAYDDQSGRMIIFGGAQFASDNTGLHYFNETRVLDFKTLTWQRPKVTGSHPPARYWACPITIVGTLGLLTGGYSGPRRSDTCSEDAMTPAEMIQIRYTPGMGGGYVTDPDAMIDVNFGKHSETFFLDLSPQHDSNNSSNIKSDRPPRVAANDRESLEWVQPEIAGRNTGYRYGASCTASGTRVYMFGGWDGSRACPMNDLVCLDLTDIFSPPADAEIMVLGGEIPQ